MATSVEVNDLSTMSVSQLSTFISTKLDEEVGEMFLKNKISGSIFLLMSEEQIAQLVPAIGDVIMLQQLQTTYKTPTGSYQVGVCSPCACTDSTIKLRNYFFLQTCVTPVNTPTSFSNASTPASKVGHPEVINTYIKYIYTRVDFTYVCV